jgi:hypothetical protein
MAAAELSSQSCDLWRSKRLAAPRRDCDFLASVIAYLRWRQTSAHVAFLSHRNQPADVGCIAHAINLCNQALALTDGAALPCSEALPPKKQPASQKSVDFTIPKNRKAASA